MRPDASRGGNVPASVKNAERRALDGVKIVSVDAGSPAARAGLRAGETLLQIDGTAIRDVLDYKFYSYDARLTLRVLEADGGKRPRGACAQARGRAARPEFRALPDGRDEAVFEQVRVLLYRPAAPQDAQDALCKGRRRAHVLPDGELYLHDQLVGRGCGPYPADAYFAGQYLGADHQSGAARQNAAEPPRGRSTSDHGALRGGRHHDELPARRARG